MVIVHELWLAKGSKFTRLTPITGDIQWRSNTDELGDELTFPIAVGDGLPKNPLDVGDMVILRNKEELFRGIIVDEDRSDRASVGYTAFDFAFYLNKSTATYQFKKMRADKCINKILNDFDINIGSIPTMRTNIDKIYNNKKVSDIIQEILDKVKRKTGTKYDMEMRANKLFIEKRGSRKIKSLIDLYGKTYDATEFISSASRKRSIQDMTNVIQVVGEDDKVVHTERDNKMINKYGRLQDAVTLEQDEKRSAKKVAKAELKELSKVSEETSIELLGDNNVRANRILEVNEPITGIKGDYLITSATHNISDGIYTMQLDLEGM